MKIDRRAWQVCWLAVLSVISDLEKPPEIAAAEAAYARELVELRVVAKDTRELLQSEFYTFPPLKGTLIGRTRGKDRVYVLYADNCPTRVRACPDDEKYEVSTDLYCEDIPSSPYTFTVTPIEVANSWRERLKEAQETNDLASVLYWANELRRTNARDGQGVGGEEAEELFYESLSQLLGTNSAAGLDPTQGRVVMDPELKRAVKEFQQDEGLFVDGRVGPETLRAIRETFKTGGDVFD